MELNETTQNAVKLALRDALTLMRTYAFSTELAPHEHERVLAVQSKNLSVKHVAAFVGKHQRLQCAYYVGGKLRQLLYFSRSHVQDIERAMRFMNLFVWHMWQYRALSSSSEPYDSDLPFSVERAKQDAEKESQVMDAIIEIERAMNAAGLLKSRRLGGIPTGDSKSFKAAAISELFTLKTKLESVTETLRVHKESTAAQDLSNAERFEAARVARYALEAKCEQLEKDLGEAVRLLHQFAAGLREELAAVTGKAKRPIDTSRADTLGG